MGQILGLLLSFYPCTKATFLVIITLYAGYLVERIVFPLNFQLVLLFSFSPFSSLSNYYFEFGLYHSHAHLKFLNLCVDTHKPHCSIVLLT